MIKKIVLQIIETSSLEERVLRSREICGCSSSIGLLVQGEFFIFCLIRTTINFKDMSPWITMIYGFIHNSLLKRMCQFPRFHPNLSTMLV